MGLSRPAFQGHWNQHGSIGNLWLPISSVPSNHEHVSYRFRDKRRFQLRIWNYPTHMYLTPYGPSWVVPLEFCSDFGAKKQKHVPTRMSTKFDDLFIRSDSHNTCVLQTDEQLCMATRDTMAHWGRCYAVKCLIVLQLQCHSHFVLDILPYNY